jgi:starch synthase
MLLRRLRRVVVKILFSSSELAPLCQSGGLGDAVSGLARALGAAGHEVTCIIPAYRSALRSHGCPRLIDRGPMTLRFRPDEGLPFELSGRLLAGSLFPGVEVVLVDIPQLYDRPGIYGEAGGSYGDNGLRFIALGRAAAYYAEAHQPDVVVAHDWHASLTIAALRTSLDRGPTRAIGTVQVVHNNAHQGRLPASCLALSGLARDLFHKDGVESWGELNLLKCGLAFADRIVAVSPTYAKEIQTAAFGEGLDGMYRGRSHRLRGVVNGIDTARFDPSTDLALAAPYSSRDPAGKRICRERLLQDLNLDEPPPGMLVTGIGRLAEQKGWDVLLVAIDGLVKLGCTIALLGDGDADLARQLRDKMAAHPRRVWFRSAFDEGLSRRLYAGADVVLVPSRFEPCGLVQLIGQRYGTVPVAHATGGLVDTIRDPHFAPHKRADDVVDPWGTATGCLFSPLTAKDLVEAVARVAALGQTGRLPEVQRRLMALDVSWDEPAQSWQAILTEVVSEARARW